MRKILCSILFVAFIAMFHLPASGQLPGPLGDIFQGQPPPPGAVSVLGRAFFEAGEAGFGNALTLLIGANDRNVRQELGLTDAEVNSIRMVSTQMLMNAPQYANRFRTMTDEGQQGIQDDLIRDMGRITQALNTALPQERQENVQRFMFQALGGVDSPLISINALEALNLTEGQRANMQGIFAEMRAERFAHGEKALEMAEKVIAAGGPQNLSQEDREEMQRLSRELEAQSFETAARLAARLRQHLTPEQLELERQLIASRPGFLPPLPRQMRENQGAARIDDAEGSGGFVPGAGSWRPGDPLPVEIQRPQDRRFPRPQ